MNYHRQHLDDMSETMVTNLIHLHVHDITISFTRILRSLPSLVHHLGTPTTSSDTRPWLPHNLAAANYIVETDGSDTMRSHPVVHRVIALRVTGRAVRGHGYLVAIDNYTSRTARLVRGLTCTVSHLPRFM